MSEIFVTKLGILMYYYYYKPGANKVGIFIIYNILTITFDLHYLDT